MESLDTHLKKISQLPDGLQERVESDLIRKLTSVQPAPESKAFFNSEEKSYALFFFSLHRQHHQQSRDSN